MLPTMSRTDPVQAHDDPYATYLRNHARGRQNAAAQAADLNSDDDRIVAAAALGLAAGAAGSTTPLPREAFLAVLDEYLRQPWGLD